ncbi:MAG: RpiB/LacA/LacB family sugar-phosphate isomerase [Chloroflexi bacterium]|nr:RpiB/LacA/LacB family sugar-phosphate isomerase [Chloroflexota bacterium]
MRIAVGSDERTHLTDQVIKELEKRGTEVELYGALGPEQAERLWPLVGNNVAKRVANGACQEGILFCYTGTGVSMAANKVPGIRAALCVDAATASGAKRWNHANVLVMSLRTTTPEVAREILDAWFTTPYGDGEDAECVARLAAIEQSYSATPAQHSSHKKVGART